MGVTKYKDDNQKPDTHADIYHIVVVFPFEDVALFKRAFQKGVYPWFD
jgi:hypothetical protein